VTGVLRSKEARQLFQLAPTISEPSNRRTKMRKLAIAVVVLANCSTANALTDFDIEQAYQSCINALIQSAGSEKAKRACGDQMTVNNDLYGKLKELEERLKARRERE
jgi:flagellar biosynthesis/type III secretory pathway M-ring protein FliF/YscJ